MVGYGLTLETNILKTESITKLENEASRFKQKGKSIKF